MLHYLKVRVHQFLEDLKYVLLNYFVANIPCWHIRKLFYRMFGMQIGKNTRIHMKCIILSPQRIKIGERTVINEHCFIDGRGGLKIGNDSSISVFSMIITGSHDMYSESFKYKSAPITIGNNVWLGARAIVLSKAEIEDYAVIGAGAVFMGLAKQNGVYLGVPAKWVKDRGLLQPYHQTYKPFMR